MAMNGVTSTWGGADRFLVDGYTMGSMKESEVPEVLDCNCPRCGELHKDLATKKFGGDKGGVQSGFMPKYAICPKTGEPIVFLKLLFTNVCDGETILQSKKVEPCNGRLAI